MNKKAILLILVLALSLLLVACGKNANEENIESNIDLAIQNDVDNKEEISDNKEEISNNKEEYSNALNALFDNFRFFNMEDIEGYMSTLDVSEELVEQTKHDTMQVFELYDLNVDIVEAEVLSIDENEAKIQVVQVTKK